MHVWSSRAVVCEPRRPGLVGPPGFHTTAREPKRTFQGPGLQKPHQNSTKGPPRERRKNENCGGRGKKRAKFWAVRRRGRENGRGPDTHNTDTHNTHQHTPTHTNTQQHTTTHTNTQQHTTTHTTTPMLFFVRFLSFVLSRVFVFLSRLSFIILSRCRFFVPNVCFFLSRFCFFLSRRPVAYFVPFLFFLSRCVFFVPLPYCAIMIAVACSPCLLSASRGALVRCLRSVDGNPPTAPAPCLQAGCMPREQLFVVRHPTARRSREAR